MSPEVTPPQVTNAYPSPAESLGLVDYNFNVQRSNGFPEAGWGIVGLRDVVDQRGNPVSEVIIVKDEPDGRVIRKIVDKEDLLSWQLPEVGKTTAHGSIQSLGTSALGALHIETGQENLEKQRMDHLSGVVNQLTQEAPKDDAGNFLLADQMVDELKEALRQFGFMAGQPTEAGIRSGVEAAKKLVEANAAVNWLKRFPFIDGEGAKNLIGVQSGTRFTFDHKKPLYINPNFIKGASSFDSWAGRGYDGTADKSYKKNDGTPVTGRSINAITDYATRETAIPSLDFLAMDVILTDSGVILYAAHSGHRIAAAKLRSEALGFSSLAVYDTRSKNIDSTQP